MGALVFNFCSLAANPTINRNVKFNFAKIAFPIQRFQICGHERFGVSLYQLSRKWSCSISQSENGEEQETSVQELRVPSHWLEPSKASEESEWLRAELHKWLDEEYCPEDTNIIISKVAAESFYRSLVEKRVDLGEMLLTMARDLESISYQESFHGAFSSANAAVNLILQRMLLQEK